MTSVSRNATSYDGTPASGAPGRPADRPAVGRRETPRAQLGSSAPPIVGSARKRANARPISSNTFGCRARRRRSRGQRRRSARAPSRSRPTIGSGPPRCSSSAIDATAALRALVASGRVAEQPLERPRQVLSCGSSGPPAWTPRSRRCTSSPTRRRSARRTHATARSSTA